MNRIATDTKSTQNISSALLTYTYTADADRELLIQINASGLAGDGIYRACVSKQINGTGGVYQSPTTAVALAATVTTAFLPSITLAVESGDVVKTYLQGLAADTSVGIVTEVFDASTILSGISLADDAITASKFDESTAFPVKSADTGSTAIARVGADSDTLETLSDQIDLQAVATELAKVPKSDSTVTWNSTALASINAEVDTALNTAIPGSPTANSVNERVAAIDDLTQASGAGDLAAILLDTGTTLDDLVDDLESRLTATRAGYLDNLSAGAVAQATELAKVPKSDGVVTWNDTAKATLQAEATDALNAYDPPTKAELDSAVSPLATQTSVNDLPTNSELATALAAADDAVLAAIAALENLSAAEVNAEMVDALTVDVIADSIATDGSRPTFAQAMLMLTRFMMERSVVDVTMTVNKEDGTTSAMTFTLNDATSPTSITRAS